MQQCLSAWQRHMHSDTLPARSPEEKRSGCKIDGLRKRRQAWRTARFSVEAFQNSRIRMAGVIQRIQICQSRQKNHHGGRGMGGCSTCRRSVSTGSRHSKHSRKTEEAMRGHIPLLFRKHHGQHRTQARRTNKHSDHLDLEEDGI